MRKPRRDFSELSIADLFREEARGHVRALTEGLLSLETGISSAQAVEPLMRAAHSLKGSARVVGVPPAERLAHVMEDLFVLMGEGRLAADSVTIDLLLAATDSLAQLAEKYETPGYAEWLAAVAPDIEGLAGKIEKVAQEPKQESNASATDQGDRPALTRSAPVFG